MTEAQKAKRRAYYARNKDRIFARRQVRRADPTVILRNRLYDMKRRCYNSEHHDHPRYGGKGITICQEWLDDSSAFVEWALDNGWQRNLQIDRMDNDKGYSPENCRWVTRSQQMRNTTVNVTDFERGMRICRVCKIEKSLEEFWRDKTQSAGRDYVCKACRSRMYYRK